MVGLVDIAGVTEQVEIGPGRQLEFIGWSARAVASLLRRFPLLTEVMGGKVLTLVEMTQTDPTALGAVIAAGMKGGLENKEMEDACSDLPLQAQVDCLKAIHRVTFPKGFRPFLSDVFQMTPAPKPSTQEGWNTPSDFSARARTNGPMEPGTSTPDTELPKPSSDSEVTATPPSGT